MTGESEQLAAEQRSQDGSGNAKLASFVITIAAAAVWAWWYATDYRFGPTPWWGYVLFYGLLSAFPFVIGMSMGRWFSLLVAPAGVAAGMLVARRLLESNEDLTGEFPPAMIWGVESGIMLVFWAAGRSVRWAAARR